MRFRLAVFVMAIVLASLPARAEKTEAEFLRCPDTYQGEALADFDIFDGAPDARDYLMADDDGWDIQANRSDGQKFYLACRYGKAAAEAQFEIPANIDFCKPSGNNVDCR